ncbi:MAG: Lrp/AsnC family transcriptional regulator [Peptococcaceae bacterium]
MDNIDLAIINLLRKNSRMTSSEISKKINLSIPAVSERIRKLEEYGFIELYTVKLNRAMVNLNLTAFIFVNVNIQDLSTFKTNVIKYPCVYECHHIAGEFDYLLKIVVADTSSLESFITNDLKQQLSVAKTNTIIVLSTLKEQI